MIFKESVFEDTEVRLDDAAFQGCHFRRCVLVYGGGTPPTLSECVFEACGWKFVAAAERTILLLRAVANAMGPEGPSRARPIWPT